MDQPFSDIKQTIFAEKSILEEEYQPDTILEREDEIESYRNSLKDLLFGNNPSNVFLYGKTGVGKTVVTRFMMNALQDEIEDREEADNLHVVYHNCNGHGVYDTVRAVINSIRDEDEEEFPKKGLSTAFALEEMYKEMNKLGGSIMLVLDEIDHLKNANDLLYEVPRARANGHLTEAHVGIIGISNNYSFRESLSPKVRDTLMEKEISFSPYDTNELHSILQNRAEKALTKGGYEDKAIWKCAALAAKDTGSARQAIDLLREGGDVAEEQGSDSIREEHIQEAIERVKRGQILNKIRDQTIHAQLVLEVVAKLDADGRVPVRSKEIQSVYENVALKWGYEPLTTLKSIQTHLGDLTMLGFLQKHERNDGRAGGSYFEYELDTDAEAVIESRKGIEEKE